MKGAFQTSREIFENPIWQDIPKFRIFFYIVGNAVFAEEGTTVSGIHLKRGQYLRAYRNLASDLEYIENRSIKKYSISVISRKIEQLVKEERLKIEDTELGTLFTVVNYAMYQGFDHYKKTTWNSVGTELEQGWNNNNKDNKDKNVKNVKKKKDSVPKIQFAEFVNMTQAEYDKLISAHGEERTKRMIEILDNYKGSKGKKYASDYRAILNWVVERVEEEEQKGGNRQAKPFAGGQAASQKHNANGQAQANPNSGAVANRGSDQQDRQEGERRGLPEDSQRSTGTGSKYDIFVRR